MKTLLEIANDKSLLEVGLKAIAKELTEQEIDGKS